MQNATLATNLYGPVLFSPNVHLLGFKMIFLMYKGSSPQVWFLLISFFFSSAFILTMMNILSTDHSINEKTNSKKKMILFGDFDTHTPV